MGVGFHSKNPAVIIMQFKLTKLGVLVLGKSKQRNSAIHHQNELDLSQREDRSNAGGQEWPRGRSNQRRVKVGVDASEHCR